MKILVLLASYLDTELPYTIQHCIDNAEHPENIRFAVILQHDNSDADIIDHLPYDIVMQKYHYSESKGVGWARNKLLELYNNEDYVLQVDSHSRFAKNWDTICVNELENLGPKSILSYLPWSYLKDKTLNQDLYFVQKDEPTKLAVPNVKEIYHRHYVWYGGYDKVRDTQGKNISIPFVYGGFIFAPGNWYTEVPPDFNFYYSGEEQSIYLRTYTRGWNIYMPTRNIAWHYSASKDNPAPPSIRHNTDESIINELQKLSNERMAKLLNNEISGIYGLGTERTLEQWFEFSGVDFHKQTVIIKDYD